MTVLHVAVDDGWPGVTETLLANCAAWGYGAQVVLLQPWLTYDAYVAQYGWPVEVVPTTLEGATAVADSVYRTSPIKMASWLHCSYVRGLYPLMLATAERGHDVVLTGSRLSDAPANDMFTQQLRQRHPAGWQRLNPLAAWSTEDIYAYIDAQQIALPPLYTLKRHLREFEWVDCLSCTWRPQHWTLLKTYFPDEFAKRWPQVAPVYAVLHQALQTHRQELESLPLEA
jgi:3'-phosphoadenosine 5'-phosphosulfate sulfotransferase (PAPS reductase)/FAD synthetase